MAVNAIELKNVSMRFGKDSKDVVKNVSIKIPENSFVTVLGTSGSGKTTLIKLINRLYEATSGEIFFFGKKYSGTERRELPEANRVCDSAERPFPAYDG